MSKTKLINLNSSKHIEFIDITAQVKKYVIKNGITSGILTVYTPHTTAGITINENADPAVKKDVELFLSKNITDQNYFSHMEGNSASHIMSSIISCSETIIIEGGNLLLGTWQGIFFCEFDGPRNRKIFLKAIESVPE